MKTLKIYDPPLCCSTGVCGPSVDPSLVKIAADIAFLKSKGVEVERFNLAHNAEAFMDPRVMAEMGAEAENLPLCLIDGEVVMKGGYPDRSQLAAWFGLEAGASSEKPRLELKMASGRCCEGGDKDCC